MSISQTVTIRSRPAIWLCLTIVLISGTVGITLPPDSRRAGPAIALASAARRAGVTPGDSAARQTASGAQFLAEYDKVCEMVQNHFYDSNLNGVDWNRVKDTYRARAGAAATKLAFEDVVNAMLAELHASHTAFSTDEDIEFYMLPAVMQGDMRGHQVEHIGVMGERQNGQYVVTAVLNNGPADKAGIRAGDTLLSADGEPFASAASFRTKAGRPVRIEVQRPGESAPRSMSVSPVRQNILRAFLDATNQSAHVLDLSGKRIAYVHLWTMANEAFRSALAELVGNQLHDSDGLILDLRDGYGGSPWGYSSLFFGPDILWSEQQRGQRKATAWHTAYAKPIVVIINTGTRSAKEFLAYSLKDVHRATLVGTNTAGAFLGANTFDIGRDGLLELAVLRLQVDGGPLEGKGVAPDIQVVDRPSTGRDLQMEQAEKTLLDILDHTPSATGAGRVLAH